MFQFPGFAHRATRCGGIAPAGFPHSDIRGSQGICPSPRLFAACHVLRRLREPQASPLRPFILSLSLQARDMRQCRPPVPHELSSDRFRSPLLAESLLISVPGLLRWFTSPSMAPCGYFIHRTGAGIAPCGLPHSDIRGSKGMCPSPRPFAACRVLHRLAAPQASAVDL